MRRHGSTPRLVRFRTMLDDIERISATWCTRYSSGLVDVDASEALGVELLMSVSWQVCWAPTSTTANTAGYRASFVSVGGAARAGRGAKRNSSHKQKRIKNQNQEQHQDQDQADQQNKRPPRNENQPKRSQINDQRKQAKNEERTPNRAGIPMPRGLVPHETSRAQITGRTDFASVFSSRTKRLSTLAGAVQLGARSRPLVLEPAVAAGPDTAAPSRC